MHSPLACVWVVVASVSRAPLTDGRADATNHLRCIITLTQRCLPSIVGCRARVFSFRCSAGACCSRQQPKAAFPAAAAAAASTTTAAATAALTGQSALSNTMANQCEAAAALHRLRNSAAAAPVRIDPGCNLGRDLLRLLEARRQALLERTAAAAAGGGATAGRGGGGGRRKSSESPRPATVPPSPAAAAALPAALAPPSDCSSNRGSSRTAAAAASSAAAAKAAELHAAAYPEAALALQRAAEGVVSQRIRVWVVPFEALNPRGCPPQVGCRVLANRFGVCIFWGRGRERLRCICCRVLNPQPPLSFEPLFPSAAGGKHSNHPHSPSLTLPRSSSTHWVCPHPTSTPAAAAAAATATAPPPPLAPIPSTFTLHWTPPPAPAGHPRCTRTATWRTASPRVTRW